MPVFVLSSQHKNVLTVSNTSLQQTLLNQVKFDFNELQERMKHGSGQSLLCFNHCFLGGFTWILSTTKYTQCVAHCIPKTRNKLITQRVMCTVCKHSSVSLCWKYKVHLLVLCVLQKNTSHTLWESSQASEWVTQWCFVVYCCTICSTFVFLVLPTG